MSTWSFLTLCDEPEEDTISAEEDRALDAHYEAEPLCLDCGAILDDLECPHCNPRSPYRGDDWAAVLAYAGADNTGERLVSARAELHPLHKLPPPGHPFGPFYGDGPPLGARDDGPVDFATARRFEPVRQDCFNCGRSFVGDGECPICGHGRAA